MRGATATVSWRRAQAWHITGVCVLLSLAISRMAEAAKANATSDSRFQQPVQWVAATVRLWRSQPWHITGVCVPPTLELLRMAEAMEADVSSDSRTSKHIFVMEMRQLQR